MSSLKEFFFMGGYAFYVWGAYGAAIIVFSLNAWQTYRQKRNRLHETIKSSRPI